jgi:hypothetical protein
MNIAKGQTVTPLNAKMFIIIQNQDAMRPNDFNVPWEAQPERVDINWAQGDLISVDHGGGKTSLMPPGMGDLGKYGNRMAVLVGMDTANNGHQNGNRNATSNAISGGAVNSMHVILGRASGTVISNVNFTGTTTYTDGAQAGGVSPAQFLDSLEIPPGPSDEILNRMDSFRNTFHSEITKSLPKDGQKTIAQYWESNGTFKEAKERAQALFNNPPSANNMLGHMQMSKRIFDAGLSNAFTIDGNRGMGGSFDTHGGNGPQQTLARAQSNSVAAFLDELDAAGQLDTANIMITSAFGRNPVFNGNGGDDHLPSNGHVTLIGPDFNPGGFGKTSNDAGGGRGVIGWAVDKNSGEVSTQPNPGGNFLQMNAGMANKSILEAMGAPKSVSDQYFPNTDVLEFLKK